MQEKQIKIDGLTVNYGVIGKGDKKVLLLHGWGLSSERYREMLKKISRLEPNITFYIPDLPGFGKSEEPKENWSLDDYVNFTEIFIEKIVRRKNGFEVVKNILEKAIKKEGGLEMIHRERKEKIILMAHSFGGRIAIKYIYKRPEDIEKIFLTGAAGIKHKLTIKKQILSSLARIFKTFFNIPVINIFRNIAIHVLYKALKEKDYKEASPKMKNVMKNVIEEDLSNLLEHIKTPTILIWGENDQSTPLRDAKIMKREISNSKLFIVKNANHSLPYNNPEDFIKIFLDNI